MLVTVQSKGQLGQEEDIQGRAHELVLFMVNLRLLWDLQKGDLGSEADQLFTLGNSLILTVPWCPTQLFTLGNSLILTVPWCPICKMGIIIVLPSWGYCVMIK